MILKKRKFMNTLKQLQFGERPREKMWIQGADSLNNAELLAVILGKGGKNKDVLTLAYEIIHYLETTSKDIKLNDLLNIKGIGKSKACQVLASIEFSKRFFTKTKAHYIKRPGDAIPLLASLKKSIQEEFVVLTLDSASKVINIHFITKGLVNENQVHPRETFCPAIQDRAVAILLAHNHPSGSLVPSLADRYTTKRMVEVSKTMGISIVDHLILSSQGFVSLREEYPEYFE